MNEALAFSLDEDARELRIDGREIALQPRVFDLIAYLYAQRDRVVSKDELLERVWPDVLVTEASVERAVSVARSALRDAGRGAIRTYPRRGYRFFLDGEGSEPPARVLAAPEHADVLAARAAAEAGDCLSALERYAGLAGSEDLAAEDLERWGLAAHRVGRLDEAVRPLERAVVAGQESGDHLLAARAATFLADVQFERRESALARGWLGRAGSLLAGHGGTYEEGVYSWVRSRVALFEGEIEDSLQYAERVLELGSTLPNRDLEALGLTYRGLALVAFRRQREGLALQDEAGVAVIGGGISPWVGGIVHCSLIWSSLDCGDWNRARQWADLFTRWCSETGANAFPGLCRLHQAEVLRIRGDLDTAEQEVLAAIDLLVAAAPWAEGDARRVQGDVYLHQGKLAEAEQCYRRCYELGWEPEPGYSQLLLVDGRSHAAVVSLERALQSTTWPVVQRRGMLLASLVLASLADGNRSRAEVALAELETSPELCDQLPIQAMALRAQAELHLLDPATTATGIGALRRALALWSQMSAPLNVVDVRLRLARAYLGAGEVEAAEMELAAAEAALAGFPTGTAFHTAAADLRVAVAGVRR